MTSQPDLPDLPDLGSGTAFEHALLATAFHLLLAEGRPVSPARLAAALASDPARVERTLARLDQHGRTRRDPAGAVTGSHGLSVTPTRHELRLEQDQENGRDQEQGQERRYWTWCAWDAVGILAALDASGRTRSTSPASGAPIELDFHHGSPRQADPALVVFFTDTDCCAAATDPDAATGSCASSSVIDDWCPLVNFFEHADAAQAWAAEHRVRGTAVGWPRRPAAARPRGRNGSPEWIVERDQHEPAG